MPNITFVAFVGIIFDYMQGDGNSWWGGGEKRME